jgi:hypothetical protein
MKLLEVCIVYFTAFVPEILDPNVVIKLDIEIIRFI